jgi:FkbM family methyltransferase
VVGFEPSPAAFGALRKNVQVNGYENATVEQKAVSDRDGTLKLYISRKHQGDNKIYATKEARTSIDVPVTSLDNYLKNIGQKRVDFIKIDIEGAEVSALRGMQDTLNRNRNLVLMTEVWPCALEESGTSAKEYFSLLERCGFTLKLIDDKKQRLAPLDKPFFFREYTTRSRKFANLLCVRK